MKKKKASTGVFVLAAFSLYQAWGIVSQYSEPTLLAYALFIVPVVLILVAVSLRIAGEREQAAAAEHQQPQKSNKNDDRIITTPEQPTVRQSVWGKINDKERNVFEFYLIPPDDSETQAKLHDLRIKTIASGGSGDLIASPEPDGYVFRFNGLCLGIMDSKDDDWLSDHMDDLETWIRFDMYGGDTDKNGCLRPVTTKITAKLYRDDLNPPPCGPLPLPPSRIQRLGLSGDEVVFVSSTKKIHLGMALNCSVNLNICTPMLYEEALRDGCSECGNCFR